MRFVNTEQDWLADFKTDEDFFLLLSMLTRI